MTVNLKELREVAFGLTADCSKATRTGIKEQLSCLLIKDSLLRQHYNSQDIHGFVHHLGPSDSHPITVARIEEWLAEVRSMRTTLHDWHVLFGLENLKLPKEINIGDVLLKPGGPEFEAEYVTRMSQVYERFASDPDDAKFLNLVLGRLSPSAYAMITVRTGGSGKAKDVASVKCSEMVAVLRYFAQRLELSTAIGIVGQPKGSRGGSIAVSESGYSVTMTSRGLGREFTLSDDTVRWMEERGLGRLREILGKRHRTEIEDRLVAALRWFGESIVEHNPTDKFVKCVICLEALLGQKNPDDNITSPLAEKVAFLLHDKGCTAERLGTFRRIKTLYGRRSSTVHTGRFTDGDDKSVYELSDACVQLLERFITGDLLDRFTDWDQLVNWFEQQRFS